jgi:hypothetical protein
VLALFLERRRGSAGGALETASFGLASVRWFSARNQRRKVRGVRQEERKRIGEKREGGVH